MFSAKWNKNLSAHPTGLVGLILLFASATSAITFAQGSSAYFRQARKIETGALGISSPAGLAFSPAANALLVVEAQPPVGTVNIVAITLVEDPAGSVIVPQVGIPDPINMAFDPASGANRFLLFETVTKTLAAVQVRPDGLPNPTAITRFEARQFGLQNPRGITIDPVSGDLFILDNTARRIVRVIRGRGHSFDGEAALREGRISQVDPRITGVGELSGLAFNPNDGHLYLLSQAKQMLYELTPDGQVASTRDLSNSDDFKLIDPQGMVFAPSGDLTDDPALMSLYIADSGRKNGKAGRGRIIELSFAQPATVENTQQATSVRTTNTYQWSPPSPDPMGIGYISTSNRLLISDSEVEEMSIFSGVNVFDATLQGSLTNTFSTISFSKEPTGVAFNPNNRRLFISDDDADEVYEIDPGADGQYFTSDDIRTSFDTRAINNMDAEDVAFGNGNLYLADGLNSEAWEIRPGANGRFDGPPPAGDDQASHFDTSVNGIADPEAITFSSAGTLFITGHGAKQVIETTTSGALLNVIDIAFLNAKNPSGLAYAPNSINPAVMSLYIVARGVDNDSDPNENDGKMYEISFGGPPPQVPSISIDNVTVTEGNSGTVNANFTVTLSPTSSQTVTVAYATADGTATASSDYVAASGTVSFPAGTTTQTIPVAVNGDELGEPNETFFVNLSNPSNATIADDQGQGTIIDDDQQQSTTITLYPTDDTRVKSTEPTSNFGASGTLRIRQSSTIYRSYLKFVVSGLSGSVQSAKLRLKVTQASNSGGSVFLVSNDYLGTSTPWTEFGLNYNSAPALDGTPLSTVGSVTVGQVVEFDVTAAITSDGTYSFGMKNSSSTEVQYSSKEGKTKPELVIQAGPGAAPKTVSLQPERLELSSNYPNPFNAQTVIDYALPKATMVRLVIYNILGQRVRQLVDEIQPAGYKRVIWDGKNENGIEVSSGVYFYRLEVGQQTLMRKLVLQR